ncbi:MAG: 23S rRNA (pseudouridine(1915)-N(3))-methyltransferase RlmH [Myxococcales bacterium]
MVSVGKDKGPTLELASEYARRIPGLELLEVRSSEAVLAQVKGQLWVLDQRGVELTSEELSSRLAAQMTFAIGGDEGHPPALREKAHVVWSLSKLTLPHRLARVVVLEQLYRALEIRRGGPYHK